MKTILLLGRNNLVEKYAEHILKIDLRNDIVYYPTITDHHSEYPKYIDYIKEDEPPVVTTQSKEMIEVLLNSDLDLQVITVRDYNGKLQSRKMSKKECLYISKSFNIDFRD